ncbi:MAG: hypothetical protein M1371_04990 [Actinobacteria bacterium]|nr:hypothetical protein [Actinomycetota bacterium]
MIQLVIVGTLGFIWMHFSSLRYLLRLRLLKRSKELFTEEQGPAKVKKEVEGTASGAAITTTAIIGLLEALYYVLCAILFMKYQIIFYISAFLASNSIVNLVDFLLRAKSIVKSPTKYMIEEIRGFKWYSKMAMTVSELVFCLGILYAAYAIS